MERNDLWSRPRREEPPPNAPAPSEGTLHPDQALLWLWRFRAAEVGALPPPKLSPSPPEGAPPLGREDLRALERRLMETASARRRLVTLQVEGGHLPDLDAQGAVYVTRDGLTAWILAYPPVGQGRELTAEHLEGALRAQGVVLGLDHALLEALPGQEDRYFHLLPAARGVAPVPGRDGSVTDCFPREVEARYPTDGQGQVDYTAPGLIHQVREGETICQILPPTPGTPGASVRGEPLPARDGRPAQAPKGRNTRLSEDGSRLEAACDGHVVFSGRSFEVRKVLEVAGDVDYSTGSLNYLGDVHIRGDVRSGFTVRALGDVRVDGVIEDTSVEAGGDLVVGGGVQGNGKAVIRAHRDVYARYLESCRAYVQGDLHCDCLIGCQVYCDGSVRADRGRGAIIGGSVHAAHDVDARCVGARSEVRTSIELGGFPCEDQERREVLWEVREMERDLELAQRQPDGPAKAKRISDLRLRTTVSRMKLEQFKQKLEQRLEGPKAQGGRLRSGMLYPGTVITIDGISQPVRQEVRSCDAVLRDEAVRFVPAQAGGGARGRVG